MNKKLFLLASVSFFALSPLVMLDANIPKEINIVIPDNKGITENKAITDADIASAVKESFSADKSLAPFASAVDAKTEKGVVTLSGSVNSEKTKADFAAKAKDVPGVMRVINNITVTGPAPMR